MKRLASWNSLVLVVVLGTIPSWAQDARNESDFLDMVHRSPGGGAGSVDKASCEEVDLSAFLAEDVHPEMQTLLVGLSVHPEDPAMHNGMGNYYAKRSLWGKAEHAYGCALALDNSLALVWNNLGIVHMGRRDASAAISALRRATKLDSDYALAFYNLGLAYDMSQKNAPAVDAYERAITLDPRLATIAYNPHVAGNRHQTVLFLRRLQDNPIALASSLDE